VAAIYCISASALDVSISVEGTNGNGHKIKNVDFHLFSKRTEKTSRNRQLREVCHYVRLNGCD
nr:hypothetical protein [Treponemataceae bacterium]